MSRYILINWQMQAVVPAIGSDPRNAVRNAIASFGTDKGLQFDAAFLDDGTNFVQLDDVLRPLPPVPKPPTP